MKKRNLKNLALKRETISSLDSKKVKAGGAMTFGVVCIALSIALNCPTAECDLSLDCGGPGGSIP